MLTIAQGAGAAAVHDTEVVDSVQAEPLQTNPPVTTYRVTFRQGLRAAFSLDQANPATVQSEEFSVRVHRGAAVTPYDNLALDPAHPRYFATVINGSGGPVVVEPIEPPPPELPPNNLPDAIGPTALGGGAHEDLTKLADGDYTDALDTLQRIGDVNIVSIPDATIAPNPAVVQQAMIAHCELMQDRFAVLDSLPGLPPFGAGANPGVDTQRRGPGLYPGIRRAVLSLAAGTAGRPRRTDPRAAVRSRVRHHGPRRPHSRGVQGAGQRRRQRRRGHPAQRKRHQRGAGPAEPGRHQRGADLLRRRPAGAVGRPYHCDRPQLGLRQRASAVLVPGGVDPGRHRVRGIRAEQPGLCGRSLKRSITAFLLQQWRDGALFGNTPEEAFYVRIDEVLNPFSEQALGRLHIEIGARPAFPAEFIIVRIGISAGSSQVTEG